MAFFGLTALGMQNPFAVSADVINHFLVSALLAVLFMMVWFPQRF